METAGTLLEYGALTNPESKAGFTPLHLTAQQVNNNIKNKILNILLLLKIKTADILDLGNLYRNNICIHILL